LSLRLLKIALATLLILSVSGTVTTVAFAQEDALPEQVVKDLYYGETLYHFYQEDYFDALSKLLILEVKNPNSKQGKDPVILLGGLYLAYGLYNRAFDIFTALINEELPKPVKDRAWFYLGKLYYLKGYHENAEKALLSIGDTLPDHRNDERLNILANIYIKNKRYDDAIQLLSGFSSDSVWEHYARYNLGVALIKIQKNESGIEQLKEVADLDPENLETRALRDKANLAVGFAYLRKNNAENAINYLENVRLSGPLSNKALLGIGWAHAAQNEHKRALIPWLELKSRSRHDIAVQESLLAIPFTFEQLNADQNALEFYQFAVKQYEKEIQSLKTVMTDVDAGEFIRALQETYAKNSKRKSLVTTPPKSHITPYIETLLSKNEFQQAYLNYRDLIHLQNILNNWTIQFPAYELMLAERKKRYQDKFPEISNDERLKLTVKYKHSRDKFAIAINEIESDEDPRGLATENEIKMLERISNIKSQFRINKTDDLVKQKQQLHIINGLLFWQLSRNYVPRLWQAKSDLYKLDKALLGADEAQASLEDVIKHAPSRFVGFNEKIDANKQRVKLLNGKLTKLIHEQARYLVALSLRELNNRQRILQTYHSRARFSLARIYDKLATGKKASGEKN